MISLTSKEKKWTLLFLLPFYFLYGQFLFSLLFVVAGWIFKLNLDASTIDAYFNLFYLLFLAIVSLFIFKSYLIKSFKAMKGRWLSEVLYAGIVGTFEFYVVNFVSSLIIMLLIPNSSSANQDAITSLTSLAPSIMIITTVILAPFVEEMVFRVGIFQFFYPKSRFLAYLITSLTFGFVHIATGLFAGDIAQILYLIPYGLLGLVLCNLYEKRKSIFVPMIVHLLNNLISMIVLLLL